MYFTAAFGALIVAIASKASANPIVQEDVPDYLISVDQFKHWLATTDADITYVGKPVNVLTPRSELTTMVTYCANRAGSICGGPCTVYNGGAACLAAPGTNCLAATKNVAFCGEANCQGICNLLSSCGTKLNNGFCFTPGTKSILVSTA